MSASAWLRSHAPWLLGALACAIVAMYLPWRNASGVQERTRPTHAVASGPAQWITFDGARWRLLSLESSRAPRKDPRADTQVIAATVEVELANGSRKDLYKCHVGLSGTQGRHWDTTSAFELFAGDVEPHVGCDGSGRGPDFTPLPETPAWRFTRYFLVPADLDPATARVDIVIPDAAFAPRGRFVRLLPPAPPKD